MKYNSDEVIYKAGEVYDVPTENGFADRWIKRGAEVVTQVVPKEEPVQKQTKPQKPSKPQKPQVKEEAEEAVGEL